MCQRATILNELITGQTGRDGIVLHYRNVAVLEDPGQTKNVLLGLIIRDIHDDGSFFASQETSQTMFILNS